MVLPLQEPPVLLEECGSASRQFLDIVGHTADDSRGDQTGGLLLAFMADQGHEIEM